MILDITFISGVMLGFELLDDEDFNYLLVDFLIVRFLFIKEKK
jgi:hypothetical protein